MPSVQPAGQKDQGPGLELCYLLVSSTGRTRGRSWEQCQERYWQQSHTGLKAGSPQRLRGPQGARWRAAYTRGDAKERRGAEFRGDSRGGRAGMGVFGRPRDPATWASLHDGCPICVLTKGRNKVGAAWVSPSMGPSKSQFCMSLPGKGHFHLAHSRATWAPLPPGSLP